MKHRIKLDPATIVIGIFFVIAAIFLMMPFYFMFLSSLKPGTEILRLGLSFKIAPDVMSFSNYNALNTYRDGIYWAWYKSSLTVMLLQTAVGSSRISNGIISRIRTMMSKTFLPRKLYIASA